MSNSTEPETLSNAENALILCKAISTDRVQGISYESDDEEEPDISHLLCDSSESESDSEE